MNVCGNCYFSSLSGKVCYMDQPLREVNPLDTCAEHHPERGADGRSESLLRLLDLESDKRKRNDNN